MPSMVERACHGDRSGDRLSARPGAQNTATSKGLALDHAQATDHRRHAGCRTARGLLEISVVRDPAELRRRDRGRRGPAHRAAARRRAGSGVPRPDRRAGRHRRRVRRRSLAVRRRRPPRDSDAEGEPHRRGNGAHQRRAGARHAGPRHLRRRAAAGGGTRRHADPAHSRRDRGRARARAAQPARTSPATPWRSPAERCCGASWGRMRCR